MMSLTSATRCTTCSRREFRVLKAHSAEEGYRLMQEEEVHIVMSDQRMPQITGVELLTKLKARHPHAVRMLFTGFADLESIIAAINQGHIFQFLKKPWQPEELIAAVRQAAPEYDRLETRPWSASISWWKSPSSKTGSPRWKSRCGSFNRFPCRSHSPASLHRVREV